MNTETPKKSKFDILEEIMINFQNDYEADDAHDLGFVEGVRYALNIMDMTDAGKNKELLKRLLNILEK